MLKNFWSSNLVIYFLNSLHSLKLHVIIKRNEIDLRWKIEIMQFYPIHLLNVLFKYFLTIELYAKLNQWIQDAEMIFRSMFTKHFLLNIMSNKYIIYPVNLKSFVVYILCMYVCVCMRACMCVIHTHVCMYMYIYVCMYMYTYIYIHTHTTI